MARIEDPFGNTTTITYQYPDGSWMDRQIWTITDPHGRVHYVHLDNYVKVTSIDYENVGGTRAVYQFFYSQQTRYSPYDTYPFNNHRVWQTFLNRVRFPDGTDLHMTRADGSLYYHGDYIGWVTGVLAGLRLPTGGSFEWDFTEWEFQTADPFAPNKGAGVTHRRMIRRDGTTESTVRYTQTQVPYSGWPKVATRTDVVYPDGHCSLHYFVHQPDLVMWAWHGWNHGLPYHKEISDGERFLSTETWDSSSGNHCAGTKLRSTWVRYEHDQLPFSTHHTVADRWFASNIRLANTRTVYHDDSDRFVDTRFEDFDGLGHYRRSTVTGNLNDNAVPDQVRMTTVGYNPGRGTYEIDQVSNHPTANHDYAPIAPSERWLLPLYDSVEVSEPGASQLTSLRREYDFDPTTGFLRGARVLAAAAGRSANDILTIYTPTVEGQVASVAVYGGDVQALGTGAGWSPPPTWVYKTENTYQYGVLRTSRAVKPDGTYAPFLLADVDLDSSTGKVLTSRDPSGLATHYMYDGAGRLLVTNKEEGSITYHINTKASFGVPAKKYVVEFHPSGSPMYSQKEVWFDGFGRKWRERKVVPDHGWVERETLYNASGQVESVSAWGDFTKVTRFVSYDALGRVTRVRPPEGASHDVVKTYVGNRFQRVQSYVATAPGQESQAMRDTYSDTFGRTSAVVDVGLIGGLDQRTSYLYNVAGNLHRIHAQAADTGVVQERYFNYDGRGLLLAERHPEKGVNGNGWVYYYDFDPTGKLGRMLDGPNDVTYAYDALGRLLEVRDRNRNRPLKEFAYDTAPGRGAGKVHWERRHNYVTVPWEGTESDRWVEDSYEYHGLGGQTSQKRVFFANEGLLFQTAYSYNGFGQTTSIGYPSCVAGWSCTAVPPPARTVTFDYEKEYLRQVPSWTNTISYHPSGAWSQMPRVNTVTDGRDRDLTSPDRLNRFYASSSVTGVSWDSGVIQFDGSTNMKAAGAETYAYDKTSRLVSGTAAEHQQSYTYDAFSNLTQIAHTQNGSTATRGIAVVPSTNRLSVATYDGAGNTISWGGSSYSWDALNSMTQLNGGEWTYLYDAQDRRVAILKDGSSATREQTFSVRGLSGAVLREVRLVGDDFSGALSWDKDYIFADGSLLASVGAGGEIRHYHKDHLGTPRLITKASGELVGQHDYLPYGEEVTDSGQNDEVMKYTLHQRDRNGPGTTDDLDYMLARYYSAHLARFLSCDPERGDPRRLRTLNRYAYAWGNPVRYRDPDGRDPSDCLEVVTVTEPDGTTTTTTRRDRECEARNQQAVGQCNDPVLSRLNPECTGQDSLLENIENNPGVELDSLLVAPLWDANTEGRVNDLHGCIRDRAYIFISAAKNYLDINLRINGVGGFRSWQQQDDFYEVGRRGVEGESIITYREGGESLHNWGLAFDVYPIDRGQIDSDFDWGVVGDLAGALGLEWGGSWNDSPHLQLPMEDSLTYTRALMDRYGELDARSAQRLSHGCSPFPAG